MEGRYGTVHYLQRAKPDTPMVSFPIDDNEITIGRGSTCSIRLYYPEISPVHCRLFMNEEKKAFLAIHGSAGAIIDDCQVYPSQSDSKTSPTIIPLTNNAEFEIQGKRFKFTYPPKEMRAALLATPSHPSNAPRRALRLSMIQSALVFTPRPSPNPQENLRVLQSPLKPFRSPSKLSRIQDTSGDEDECDEEQEIVLVEGNHPRVFEEGKDLVIAEDVVVNPESDQDDIGAQGARSHGGLSQRMPVEPSPQPPKTPRNRLFPRPSLHRAVLIRSAQRAIIRHEMEKEERAEEEEVAESIVGDDDNFLQDVEEEASPFIEDVEMEVDEAAGDSVEDMDDDEEGRGVLGSWRKSLGSMWPFRPSSSPEKDVPQDVSDEENEEEDFAQKQESDEGEPEPLPSSSPILQDDAPLPSEAEGPSRSRFSLGGAMRIKKEEPKWRVNDINLPPLENQPDTSQDEIKKERLSDDQREAIRERRRSALLRTPDMFFGGTPGTRKTQPLPSVGPSSPTRLAMASLTEVDEDTTPPDPSPARRLFGNINIPSPQKKGKEQVVNADDSEELDTRILLERMKETVEGLKRRKSIASPTKPAPPPPTKKESGLNARLAAPRFSLLNTTPMPSRSLEAMDVDESLEALHTKIEPLQLDADESQTNNEKENLAIPSIYPSLKTLQQQPSTPAMDGLRKLFPNPKPMPSTPAFDGVGEMLQTPKGYKAETPGTVEVKIECEPKEDPPATEEDEADQELPYVESDTEPIPAPLDDTPSDETNADSHELPSDNEAEQEPIPQVKTEKKPATPALASSAVSKGTSLPGPQAKTKVTSKGKGRLEVVEEKPARRTTRRTRTTTTSSEETEPTLPPKTIPRPTRQTASTTPFEAPATRTRLARKPAVVPAKVKEEVEDSLNTLTKKPTTRKTTIASRSKTKADGIKEESATAVLDTVAEDTSAKPRATRTRSKIPVKEPSPPESPVDKQEEEAAEKENSKKKTVTRAKKTTRSNVVRDVDTEPELPTTKKRATRTRTKTAS